MLQWTFGFLIVALIAALFGFTTLAGAAATIARAIFLLFVVLFVFGLVAHLMRKRP